MESWGLPSLHADSDFIAWPADVGQTHWDGEPRRNAARNPKVHLFQARAAISRIAEYGRVAKKQNLGEPAAHGYLRRDHTAVSQARRIHCQNLSGNGRVAGRREQSCRGV